MSIIAKALQKAQKERAEKIKREEEELKKVRAEAAARMQRMEKAAGPETIDNPGPIQEHTATSKTEKTNRKKSPHAHYLITIGIIVASGAFILSFLLLRPFLDKRAGTSEQAPEVTRAGLNEAAERTAIPAKENAKKNEMPVASEELAPTAKNPVPAPEASDLPQISGIMYSPSAPQAIIGGVLVTEGETVNGYTIIRIEPSVVIISSQDKEYELHMR
ncbi:MAG: hypothetical protein GF409_01845 [Candidatus Omnitrophica bacterium]|nr:hypothetical protein [Candidatus Omnitrophota bacterium]